MREIKFRVWDKQLKEIKPISQIDFEENRVTYLHPNDNSGWRTGRALFDDEFVLMQSIGLFDKNGVEIFEGDIIDYSEFLDECDPYFKDMAISPIEWDTDRWRLRYSAASYMWHKMVVIGNVHENPDLMESE